MKNTIPVAYQNNVKHAGQTLNWVVSDSQEEFEKNCAKPTRRKILEDKGWLNLPAITYTYNQHGFREQEFNETPAGLAFGCSFTEGVGLHAYQTWPQQLSKLLRTPVLNLGVGGAAGNTVVRLMSHYVPRLPVKFVCVLMPPESRFEYCNIDQLWEIAYVNQQAKHNSFIKEWMAQAENAHWEQMKNLLAIKQICAEAGVPVFIQRQSWLFENQFPFITETSKDPDEIFGTISLARDLFHPGPERMQELASWYGQELMSSGIKLDT